MTLIRLKNSNILQAWLVLVLCLFFGSALAAVNIRLAPVIAANKINETREKVPLLVLGEEKAAKMAQRNEALDVTSHQYSVEKQGKKITYSVYEALLKGERAGWVVMASGQGYADKIELLLGLSSNAETISGLFVLSQKETPGLGNKISEAKWRHQFMGKPATERLSVTKKKASKSVEIDAVTGATISSSSVVRIINTALEDLEPSLREK